MERVQIMPCESLNWQEVICCAAGESDTNDVGCLRSQFILSVAGFVSDSVCWFCCCTLSVSAKRELPFLSLALKVKLQWRRGLQEFQMWKKGTSRYSAPF